MSAPVTHERTYTRTIYCRHECTTLEEVNALALTDGQENESFVISPTGELCWWSKSYAERNEPSIEGGWSYQDGYGGGSVYFPLAGGETVTVLVPISVEDLIRKTAASVLAEQARRADEADRKRREIDAEVRRRAEEQYLGDISRPVGGFSTLEES